MSKVIHAFSAGGVIFKRLGNRIKVALAKRLNGKVICLPKGHIDKGETTRETASREVTEETGLTGRLIEKIGDIEYWFFEKGSKVHKKVGFFLFKYVKGSTKDHDFEVEQVKWYDLDSAIKLATYPSEKGILKKAKTLIRKLYEKT